MPYANVMTRAKANPPEQAPDDVSALTREETTAKKTKPAGARRSPAKGSHRRR